MDENTVVTLAEQAHRLDAQVCRIGLAVMCREGGETDPDAVFLTHGVRARDLDCGCRVVEFESQIAQHVAITHNGMFERYAVLAVVSHTEPLLDLALIDLGTAVHAQTEERAHDDRAQHPVHVGYGVDAAAADIAIELPQAAQAAVTPLGVDEDEVDIYAVEERLELLACGDCDLHVGICRLEGAQRMRQHHHIAHGREAYGDNMARQTFVLTRCGGFVIFCCHIIPD